jgi:hypothetical protein
MWRSSAFPWTYLESRIAGNRTRDLFDSVRTYVMFIGQPRSGTSLLGSILNAHRNMCVAQELNALKYVRRGYDRQQLFWLLLKRDGCFEKSGRRWTGYDYEVPNQWQGRFEQLEVIGDKKAGLSTDQLQRYPELWERLQRLVQVPVRIIHLVRDPFNVITTAQLRRRISLNRSVEIYFRRCETNWQLMQQHPDMIRTLRLEDLIDQPERQLLDLCDFLDITPDIDYLRDSVSILFSKPRHSKAASPWPRHVIDDVQRRLQAFPFLQGYTYASADHHDQPARRAV